MPAIAHRVLSRADVPAYLVERRVLAWRDVTRGMTVERVPSLRNRCFLARGDGGGWFLKQPALFTRLALDAARREQRFYADAHRDRLPFTARARSTDAADGILVLDAIGAARSLFDVWRADDAAAATAMDDASAALARLHRSAGTATEPAPLPWILFIAEPGYYPRGEFEGAAAQLYDLLQQDADARAVLAGARADWRVEALVHGDFKWDNVHLRASGGALLLDWEMSGGGDPAWDLGCALESPVSDAIRAADDEALLRARGGARAFLDGYRSRRALPATDVVRAVRFAGARMLQSAFSTLHLEAAVPPRARRAVQGALAILQRPHDAADDVFGAN